MAGVFACLYLTLFRLPLTPVWAGSDQFGFAMDAASIWNGETLYRDFFEMTPPGTEVVNFISFRLFGLKDWIPNLHVLLLGMLLTWEVTFVSRKLLRDGRWMPALAGAFFFAFAFYPTMQESHRWYSCAASLAALAVLMEGRRVPRLALAGFFCGLASFFTQTQGVLEVAAIAAVVSWHERNAGPGGRRQLISNLSYLGVSFAVTLCLTFAYFVWKAGAGSTYYCLVQFPTLYFPLDRRDHSLLAFVTDIPHVAHLREAPSAVRVLLIKFLVPLTYLVYLLRRRPGAAEQRSRLVLLCAAGAALLIGVAPSASYFRLCSVAAPAFIVLIYWMNRASRLQRGLMACLLGILCMHAVVPSVVRIQSTKAITLQLPRGPIAFVGDWPVDTGVLRWLTANTRPGELFFTASDPGIAYPLALQLRDKAQAYGDVGDTRPADVQNAIDTLERYRIGLIQWPPDSTDPAYYRPQNDFLQPLRVYVLSHYRMVEHFAGSDESQAEEIWRRK